MDLQLYTLELSINGLLPSCFLSFQYKVLLINSANFCNNFSHFIFNFKCIHTPKLPSFKSYCLFLLQILTLSPTKIANNNLDMAYVLALLSFFCQINQSITFKLGFTQIFNTLANHSQTLGQNVMCVPCSADLRGYSFFFEHTFYCLHFC